MNLNSEVTPLLSNNTVFVDIFSAVETAEMMQKRSMVKHNRADKLSSAHLYFHNRKSFSHITFILTSTIILFFRKIKKEYADFF